MAYPKIIQGGMGIGISNWQLARAVASRGQLGVVSGTSLDNVMARRLQEGDPGGHMRRAAAHFPNGEISRAVLDKYYVAGGKTAGQAFAPVPLYTVQPRMDLIQLTVLANFVEVFLAKEGHGGEVGINLMEKIQMPTMASLYGAILAGVDYVLMGAGIPREIPGIMDLLAQQRAATQKLSVENASDDVTMHFDPLAVMGMELPALKRPRFLAIIASVTLALALLKRSTGQIDGFIIEAPSAGGHNAPAPGPVATHRGRRAALRPQGRGRLGKDKGSGIAFLAGWFAH